MTMNKTHWVLVGLLAAQLALVVGLFWPRSTPAGAGNVPLLGSKADDITSLTISDNQGKRVLLAKSEGQWVLPEADGYPVDATKIASVISGLAEMKAGRLVAETPAAQKRLQVADDTFAYRIDVETPSGTKTVYVGTSGGVGSSHVRLRGQNQVYLVSGVADWQLGTEPAVWVNPAYFTVPQGDVVSMTLTNANGQWQFSKGSDGKWVLEDLAPGEVLNSEAVQQLLNAASYVSVVRPLGKTEEPAYGIRQSSAVVTLVANTGGGEKTYVLALGAQDPADQTYVVKSSESPYFVRTAGAVWKDWVEKKREGFLVAAPTAEPTPAR
jgi:hypothetical protein